MVNNTLLPRVDGPTEQLTLSKNIIFALGTGFALFFREPRLGRALGFDKTRKWPGRA
jgi:hypothetical protein